MLAGTDLPRSYLEVLSQTGALGLVLAACDSLEPRQMVSPFNFIHRLVLSAEPVFTSQYIQVCSAADTSLVSLRNLSLLAVRDQVVRQHVFMNFCSWIDQGGYAQPIIALAVVAAGRRLGSGSCATFAEGHQPYSFVSGCFATLQSVSTHPAS